GGAGAAILHELGVLYTGRRPPDGGRLTGDGESVHAIPSTLPALLGYSGLSLRGRLKAVRLFATIARGPLPPPDLSFDAWLAQRQSSPEVVSLFRAFLRLSTYVAASDQLSAAAAVLQMRQALSGVIYVDGGWATLVAGLIGRAREYGVTINTRSAIRAVHSDAEGVCAVLEGGEKLRAAEVVLAVSPRQALQLLGSAASAQLRECVQRSQPVVAGCLDIGLRRLPRPEVAFALDLVLPRYMSSHSIAAGLAPSGCTLLQMAYYGEGGAIARTRLEAWLNTLQPGWRDEVIMQRWLPAARICDVLPSAKQGGLAGRPTVDAAGLDRVSLCGDWVGPIGLLSDASFASAREATMAILQNKLREGV
ncbi:MAG: FAD-dependent oxidoreductase, partial [Pseudomonadales bacterium]